MHKGIELRIRFKALPADNQIVIQANSDILYLQNKLGHHGQWADILDLIDIPLALEIRAVDLADEYPDD